MCQAPAKCSHKQLSPGKRLILAWPASLPSSRSIMPTAHQCPLPCLATGCSPCTDPLFSTLPCPCPSCLRPAPLRDCLGFEGLLPPASGCGVSGGALRPLNSSGRTLSGEDGFLGGWVPVERRREASCPGVMRWEPISLSVFTRFHFLVPLQTLPNAGSSLGPSPGDGGCARSSAAGGCLLPLLWEPKLLSLCPKVFPSLGLSCA